MTKLTDYQKAALNYNKHISLTANAGSGKTTVLAKRFVEILVNEKISINNIVAITFTEKAASELYSKIAKELDKRIIDSGDNNYKLEVIRRSLVSAKISTIHSFCIDILKDYSPEAGIDANFSPIDSRISDELLDQSIDEIINSNLNEDSIEVKNLIRIFSSRSQLVSKIKQLFNKRKTTEQLKNNFYNKTIEDISDELQSKFENKFIELFEESIHSLIFKTVQINSIAADYKTSDKQIEINRILNEINFKESILDKYIYLLELKPHLLTQKGDVAKRGYLSPKLYEENSLIIEEISKLFKELNNVELSNDYKKLNSNLAVFGKSIAQFYNEINERYTNKKQLKSYLDFEDLLILTQKLLNNDEVKEALSEKYKYIMIDEYQDTNETQYNIFMPILKNLTVGNLFVVGDEKQSIYMFREAEVELFYKTQEEIKEKDNPASLLDLPHSFRLTPNIAMFTNVLFRKLFDNPNPEFNEVKYNDLICAYPNKNRGKVEILIAEEENISESELVARKILSLINDDNYNYTFDDVTVLCTKRKNFLDLEKAFSESKIPFNIVGGKGFYQQQMILDVYSYLSFLINPKNELALASILRGPYYGLADTELTQISLLNGNDLFSKLKSLPQYSSIVIMLNEHLKSAKILRPNELIRKINNDTGYWAYIANKVNGAQEIANLKKLIQKSISVNEQGFNALYDFTVYLKNAINNLDDEGQAELNAGDNSVKIMTVHQAKGLEFKVVIIYKTNQKSFDESLKAKDIIIDKNYGVLSKLPVDNNYFEEYKAAPIIGIYNYIQRRKANAELKRLLYVAITRAEQHLIVSVGMKKEKLWPDSFASMILDAVSFNMDYNEIEMSDEITFMRFVNNNYILEKENLSTKISIEKSIDRSENKIELNKRTIDEEYQIYCNPIKSTEKNEIISASKISLFLNCPKKYELTYEFGYGELTKLFREEMDFEFNNREDEINSQGNVVGSVVHSVLEKGVPKEQLKEVIPSLIRKENSTVLLTVENKELLVKEIEDLVTLFYKSISYQQIIEYPNSLNEAEFYKREYDYYLYGIIDKLVVAKDKIIIIDYKSDKINKTNISEKKDTYFNQLLFYAYIVQKKYPNIKVYDLRLIFIRDDNFSFVKKVNIDEVLEFGSVIKSSVAKIRTKDFKDIRNGCKNMKYYLLNG